MGVLTRRQMGQAMAAALASNPALRADKHIRTVDINSNFDYVLKFEEVIISLGPI